MPDISIAQSNLSKFAKRLKNSINNKFEAQISLTEATLLIAEMTGSKNIHELQEFLKKNTPMTSIDIKDEKPVSHIVKIDKDNTLSELTAIQESFNDIEISLDETKQNKKQRKAKKIKPSKIAITDYRLEKLKQLTEKSYTSNLPINDENGFLDLTLMQIFFEDEVKKDWYDWDWIPEIEIDEDLYHRTREEFNSCRDNEEFVANMILASLSETVKTQLDLQMDVLAKEKRYVQYALAHKELLSLSLAPYINDKTYVVLSGSAIKKIRTIYKNYDEAINKLKEPGYEDMIVLQYATPMNLLEQHLSPVSSYYYNLNQTDGAFDCNYFVK